MSTILAVLEIIGVFSFSIAGALLAIDNEIDFIGVVFLAVITSFGGGIIRDVLIGNTPPVFFSLYVLVIISVLTATVVFIIATIFKKQYVRNEHIVESVNNYFDAAGLGVFVISGAQICMDAGFENPFLIVVMGMISGTGGSMIRDIFLNVVPSLLKKHVYLVAAMAGAGLYYLMTALKVNEFISVPVSVLVIIIIRVLATVFKWNFPKAIDFSKMNQL